MRAEFLEWTHDIGTYTVKALATKIVEQGATVLRVTPIIVEDNWEWVCIEGWRKESDDQGPPPTAADIPVGFV